MSASRLSQALYVDFKYVPVAGLTLGTAARTEHFSDFGNTLNGKLSLHYQPVEQWQLRGSLSSGFRAPSLSQANFSSTSMINGGAGLFKQVISAWTIQWLEHWVLVTSNLKNQRTLRWVLSGNLWQA